MAARYRPSSMICFRWSKQPGAQMMNADSGCAARAEPLLWDSPLLVFSMQASRAIMRICLAIGVEAPHLLASQGLAVKVVQGQAGGRADIALVAKCMYLSEIAYTCPGWQDWREDDAIGVRYVRWVPSATAAANDGVRDALCQARPAQHAFLS